MPKDSWGTPGRDTFQLEAHEHFLAFLNSDGARFSPPYVAIQNKLSHRLQPQRVRTWKKLFEKMGVLNVPDKHLRLTDFGHVLQEELYRPAHENIANNGNIANAALAVLGSYQLSNPTTKLEFPEHTDVFPYWIVWKIMRVLRNKLHWEELNRVVIRIMRTKDIPAAIEKIDSARRIIGYPERMSDGDLTQFLGEKVNLPQRSRAMSAIFSEAGFGGGIIERKNRNDNFRYLNETHLSLIDQVLSTPPHYKRFASSQEWFNHYGKLGTQPPFQPLQESIKRDIENYPEEVVDLVAEAYLIEGKSHRNIQEKVLKRPAPSRGGGFKAMAILHYLGLDESAKGIFSGLPAPAEADSLLKEKTPWLTPSQRQKVIVLLEGFKASREARNSIKEGYFFGETEVESLSSRRVRRQQNKLRDLLMVLYSGRCALCDITDSILLRAGHIVPWAVDKDNRLNPGNAILLCILHDKLFEAGFISLDDELNLLVSKELENCASEFLKEVLKISQVFRMPKSDRPDKKFLDYHRKEIFATRNTYWTFIK
ncbi:MAG: HNH endonuclease [Bacteroidetes bacterium]|nr:HNH endonuclease [Bacteroidota bacterium]